MSIDLQPSGPPPGPREAGPPEAAMGYLSPRHLALAVGAFVFLIYLPVALSSYMNHDDYLLFLDWRSNPREDPHYVSMVTIGRPISAEILFVVMKPYFPFFPTLKFFSVLRLLNIAAMALSAGMFCLWLSRIAGNRFIAMAVTVLFFTLPGFQVYASTAISASHLPVLPLVFLALLALQWAGGPTSLGDVFSRRQLGFGALAVLLLLISLFTYQGTTFLFIACAPLIFLCSPQPLTDRRGTFLQYAAVFCTAVVMHVLVGVLILQPLVQRGEGYNPEARNVHLNGLAHAQENLETFVGYISWRAFSLWNVSDFFWRVRWVQRLVGLSVCGFLAWTCWQHRGKSMAGRIGPVLECAAYLACAFAAANAVQILYPHPNYRVILAYSGFLLFVLAWPVNLLLSQPCPPLLRRFTAGTLAAGALAAAAVAQWNTLNWFPQVQMEEYAIVRSAMMPFLKGEARTLEFTSRPRSNTYVWGDEFTRLSSYVDMPLYGMVERAFAEHEDRWGSHLPQQLVVTHWDSNGSSGPARIVNLAAPPSAGTLQVDLDAVLGPLFQEREKASHERSNRRGSVPGEKGP